MEYVFVAVIVWVIAMLNRSLTTVKEQTERLADLVYGAFSEIVRDAQKDSNIAYPGILTSDIAKHAKVDYWKAWTVLSEMSTQDPPLVHRIGDRWYPGSGWKRRDERQNHL